MFSSRNKLLSLEKMKTVGHNVEGVLKILGLALLTVSWADARPATYDEYQALENDALSVGSLRREIRQSAPFGLASEVRDLLIAGNEPKSHGQKKPIKNQSGKVDEGGFYKTFGSDADGTKGYIKETFGKGDHGYRNLDTFHKQDGDNYGFEKHTSFGHGKEGEKGGRHGAKGSYSKKDGDHEGSDTIVESHYADEGDGGYSEGDGGYYSEGEGGSYEGGGSGESGDAESDSYGNSEGYSENYSSGEGEGESEGGYSEGEDDGGYYEGDY